MVLSVLSTRSFKNAILSERPCIPLPSLSLALAHVCALELVLDRSLDHLQL